MPPLNQIYSKYFFFVHSGFFSLLIADLLLSAIGFLSHKIKARHLSNKKRLKKRE